VFVCSPSPYILALGGNLVLRRRYCGSKMSGCDAVEKSTSEVDDREILKENGEVV
jgi:hypothetical protein